ncbi:hypothetical protein HV819_08430 [Anaerococcus sp. AGMB00486]|uniref:ABC transporter permease n=2 Tax=Anaerococcus TaxID=165779 RepID=A0ABX2NBD8_9FIRM|nr:MULTISPECIES: hypothetical protein [Anaerococcus]MSS78246.1 hypothetical protein [Anaerococcus porci]NVF12004.1 hypothetical protein [Anaerococcus faecalis]
MNHYLSLFLTSERIKVSEVFNGLIYGIRKIPLMGKYLGDKYYFYDFKQIMHTFIPIFSIIWQIIKSFLSFIFVIAVSGVWVKLIGDIGSDLGISILSSFPKSGKELLFTCLPFVVYIAFNLLGNNILDNGYKFNDLSKNFNYYPKDLAMIFTFFEPFLCFIGRSLAFCIVSLLLAGINPVYTFLYSLGLYFFIINMTAFWTRINGDRKEEFIKNPFVKIILVLFFVFLISFLTLLIRVDIKVLSFGFLLLNLFGIYFSISFLKNFRAYDNMIEKAVNSYSEQMRKAENTNKNLVELKDKDIRVNKKINVEGFEYLNRLFFLRHRRILYKPTLIMTGIFILVGFGCFWILSRLKVSSDEVYKILIYAIPIISYILFKQDKILIAFYKNCDSSLLYYGFYREDKKLLKMFWLRFRAIFKIMLIPIIAMTLIYMFFFLKFIDGDIVNFILPIVYIILNGIFFTVLPLFQYYLFQPFDKEGNQKSILVVLMNLGIYYMFIFAFPSLMVYLGEIKFMLAMSVFIFLFALLASFLIYKFSPKTFKIKN